MLQRKNLNYVTNSHPYLQILGCLSALARLKILQPDWHGPNSLDREVTVCLTAKIQTSSQTYHKGRSFDFPLELKEIFDEK